MDKDFSLIDKEIISSLVFPSEEILTDLEEIKERSMAIEKAISLGNLEHLKIMIYFTDNISKRRVNTTIWAVTDKAIVLKQNVIIPIHRINKLEI